MQRRVSLKTYFVIVLLSVAVAIALNNILLVMHLDKYSQTYEKTQDVLYSRPLGMQLLYLGVCIPIVEEFLFRKLLYGFLRKKISFVAAVLISAIIFGVYHGNIVQFVYATFCGCLLAYLYEMNNTIIAPIISHMTMNLLVCIVTHVGGFEWMFDGAIRLVAITTICVMITGISLLNSKKWMLQKC